MKNRSLYVAISSTLITSLVAVGSPSHTVKQINAFELNEKKARPEVESRLGELSIPGTSFTAEGCQVLNKDGIQVQDISINEPRLGDKESTSASGPNLDIFTVVRTSLAEVTKEEGPVIRRVLKYDSDGNLAQMKVTSRDGVVQGYEVEATCGTGLGFDEPQAFTSNLDAESKAKIAALLDPKVNDESTLIAWAPPKGSGGGGGSRPSPMSSSPSPMPSSPSPMPSSPSPMPSAPSPMPSAPSPMPSAPSPMPSAPSPMPSAPSPMSSAPDSKSSTPQPKPNTSNTNNKPGMNGNKTTSSKPAAQPDKNDHSRKDFHTTKPIEGAPKKVSADGKTFTQTASNGKEFKFGKDKNGKDVLLTAKDKNGKLTQYRPDGTKAQTVAKNGTVTDHHADGGNTTRYKNGTTVKQGKDGSQEVKKVNPNGTTTTVTQTAVTTNAKGKQVVTREIKSTNNKTNSTTTNTTVNVTKTYYVNSYGGGHYYGYSPTYYPPVFHPYYYNPWRPFAYTMPYTYTYNPYGYYYTPYTHYSSASMFLTDFIVADMIANRIANSNSHANQDAADARSDAKRAHAEADQATQAAYEARQAAEEARQAAEDLQNEVTRLKNDKAEPITEELKKQIQDQITEAVQAYKAQEPIPLETLIKNDNHVYTISEDGMDVEVLDKEGNVREGVVCSLTEGDLISLARPVEEGEQLATMRVRTSKKGNCPPGTKFSISLESLQEFQNHFTETLEKGIKKLDTDPDLKAKISEQ